MSLFPKRFKSSWFGCGAQNGEARAQYRVSVLVLKMESCEHTTSIQDLNTIICV